MLCSLKSTLHLSFQLDSLNSLPSLEQGQAGLQPQPQNLNVWMTI